MIAAVALGSNLPSTFGDRADNLREALRRLQTLGNVVVTSNFYDTEPVGVTEQPRFLNAVSLLDTTLTSLELLRKMLFFELEMGRDRSAGIKNGPRVIDLDLLLFGDEVVSSKELILPHPLLHLRGFVLEPLVEIAPEMRHPVLRKTVDELWKELRSEA
ncbi:MAG: 2-amino-4-hydroxy-6-hydroxymethyldihydropteridine diphosphokinase [Bryocella sp.]